MVSAAGAFGHGAEPSAATIGLQAMINAAAPAAVVLVPKGTYTQPIRIAKTLTLKGPSAGQCILEVTANEPAISVDTKGIGQVVIEGLTVRWQLATGDEGTQRPFAVHIKDTQAVVRDCRFVPLGKAHRSPVAIRIDGFSKVTTDRYTFTGFEFTVCYGEGTQRQVRDCRVSDCGHQGLTNYAHSILTAQRKIITGSKYPASGAQGPHCT